MSVQGFAKSLRRRYEGLEKTNPVSKTIVGYISLSRYIYIKRYKCRGLTASAADHIIKKCENIEDMILGEILFGIQ